VTTAAGRRGWSAAQAAVALLACAVVVWACARHGPAVDNDTADFFSAADSVAAGDGLIMTTGRLFILWPPLPPLLLAGLAALGIGHVQACLAVNLLGLLLMVGAGARMVSRLAGSPALGLVWVIAVVLTPDVLWIYTRALSEPLFMGLCTVAIAACCEYLDAPRRRTFAVMTAAAGLAWIERYAGIVLLPVIGGAVLLAPRRCPVRVRLARCLSFGLLAGLPMLPWVIRNLSLTGTLTGSRGAFGEYGMSGAVVVGNSARAISNWFVPWADEPLLAVLAVGALAVCVAGLLTRPRAAERDAALRWFPLWGFPLVYLAFTGTINANFEIDGVGRRQVVPALPFLWALALLCVHRGIAAWRSRSRVAAAVAGGLVALFLGVYWVRGVPDARGRIAHMRRVGTGTYSTDWWQEAAILDRARVLPTNHELYSNDVYALYLFAGRRSSPMPRNRADFRRFARRVQLGAEPVYVLWVRTKDRNRLPVDWFGERVAAGSVFEESDGALWRLDPR